MPGSVLLDLARRYGGKVRSGTATTCRFLLEAPPLGYVVQQGAGHRTTLGRLPEAAAWKRRCGVWVQAYQIPNAPGRGDLSA